jgi:hypothetical protein
MGADDRVSVLRVNLGDSLSHPIYKNINRAIIYAPGSSHAYIQQIIKISQHMSEITLM